MVTQLEGRIDLNNCKTFFDGVRACATDFDSYRKANLLVPFGMTSSGYLYREGVARPYDDKGRLTGDPKGFPTAVELQPFLSIIVIQIFFMGSLFFPVAAMTRKIFIVYLQGVAFFMICVIGITVFSATRSLEPFWSGILDPAARLLLNSITRYWTVVEQNTLRLPWDFSGNSPGVFLYNRLLWTAVGLLALGGVWVFFPMSVEAGWVCAPARLVEVCLTETCDRFPANRNKVGRTRVQPRCLPAILRLISACVTTGPHQPLRADDLIRNT